MWDKICVFTFFAGLITIWFCMAYLYKQRLTPLLSIIQGRVSSRPLFFCFKSVLNGDWQGRKVRIETVNFPKFLDKHNHGLNQLFITLSNSQPWPFSFRIWQKSVTFIPLRRTLVSLLSRTKFDITQADITGVSDAFSQDIVLQFLNPARLNIITDLFSHDFNYIELHASPTENFMKITLDPRRMLSRDYAELAQGSALQPAIMESILEKLKDFETAQAPREQTQELSWNLSGL